ncbi:MAG: efflux transporter periplasmic adaptor subunit [Alphaproteobacteria bacterium]|jgi:macrolide-specific efflux system membrane fusion protein|nr:efflux transporter periplasmic adaptor subunit [Alphaproteobacteria bacterium]
MSRSKRFWAVGAVILALLGFGAWKLFAADDARVVGGPTTAVVQQGDMEDVVSALGSLQPLNYVDVGTQVSGQLQKIFFELGDNVKKGEQLAQIDPTIYQSRVGADEAQLLSLRAQVSEQQAQQALAEQQLKRQQELLAVRATSRDAYDMAAASLKVAKARIEALQAQIKQTESNLRGNQANLSYTAIFAPMSGTVVSITARQGQTLVASQMAPVILQIADLDTMTVRTQVSEADISKLQVGMAAYFTTLGNPDRRRYGKLRQILPTPTLVNNVVLFDALFDVDNPDRDLMPQMTAQVFFVIASAKNVTIVPVTALRSTSRRGTGGAERKYVVQVMSDGGSVEERPVEVGVMTRTQAEIKSGVKAGERVVLAVPAGPPPSAGGQGGGQRPPRIPRL